MLPLLSQRLVVVDPGSRWLKLVVVESTLGRLRLAHRQTVDLAEEGLLAADEVQQHLQTILPELGLQTVAIVVPQHRAIAQFLELPAGDASQARKALEAEVSRLSGLSESGMLYGYTPLKPFAKYRNPYWLTLCRASDVWEAIQRYGHLHPETGAGVAGETISEVSTTAQALFAASQALEPRPRDAVLVDLGANNTVVAIVAHGQGVFATSLPAGSQQFTDALAKLARCSVETAEGIKRGANLFAGREAVPRFEAAVDNWSGEVRRSVTEWLEDHPELELPLSTLPVYLCGGGATQEGLIEYLNRGANLRFQRWPAMLKEDADWPMDQYWTAYGLALQAFGKAPRPVSLLPAELRQSRQRAETWRRLQGANVLLLLALALVLAVGTWQKAVLLRQKQGLIARTRAAGEAAQTIERLARRLSLEYEHIQPVLERQQQTLDTLQTLAAVQQVRTNKDFWYVLFADPASYFAGSTSITNAANHGAALFPTNSTPSRREFVAELCIPQEGEETRRVLSQVVTDLKRNPLFSKVDALAPERKKNLVDPKVIITNRFFAVAMEVAAKEAQRPGAPAPERIVHPTAAPEKSARPPTTRDTRRTESTPRLKPDRGAAPAGRTNR